MDAFISYSRRDREFVRWLHGELAARGKDVFVDWEDIPDWSPDYRSDLEAAIRSAGAFLFVISPDSIESRNCRFELDLAVADGKRIRPVVHRPVAEEAVPPALTRPQWLDLSSSDGAAVEKLVAALDVDPEWVQAHTRLLVRAQEWQRRDRDSSLLLRGSDLRAAELWLARQAGRDPPPTAVQSDYVLAGRRAATRRQRVGLGSVVAALAVVSVLAVFAWVQRGHAIRDAKVARSRELATRSLAAGERRTMLGLALDAVDEYETPEAEDALRVALGKGAEVARAVGVTLGGARLVSGGERAVFACPDGSLGRLAEGVTTACPSGARQQGRVTFFSADGRYAAVFRAGSGRVVDTETGAVRGTLPVGVSAVYPDGALVGRGGRRILTTTKTGAGLWRLPARPGPAVRIWHRPGVTAVALSPDGRRFVTSRGGRAVSVWDGLTGRPLAALRALPARVEQLAITDSGLVVIGGVNRNGAGVWVPGSSKAVWFARARAAVATPDGTQVAVQDRSGRVAIRPVAQLGKTLRAFHESRAILSFSPDGAELTALGKKDVVNVWSTAFGQRLASFPATTNELPEISRDGRVLLTYGYDGTAQLWWISATAGRAEVPAQRPWASDMGVHSLTSDGDHVVALLAYDGIVRVWDRGGHRVTTVFTAGSDLDAELSPDGRFAVDSEQKRTLIWSTRSGRVAATVPENVYPADFSRDGRFLAGRRRDGTVGVWRTDDGGLERSFPVRLADDKFLLSPTDDRIAIWRSTGNRVQLFRLADGKSRDIRVGDAAADPVFTDAAFSPDGKLLAITTQDLITIVRADSGKVVRLIEGHPAPAPTGSLINTPVFTPDGSLLLANDLSSTRAWRLADGEPRYVIDNPSSKTLSSDGTVLAAYDGNALHVALWSAATGKLLTTIPLDDGEVAFADGGTRVVTGSTPDGTFRVYDCDVCGSLDRLRALARERLGRQ